MRDFILALLSPGIIAIIVVLLSSIRVVNEYERGVKFTFGKFTSVAQPGWRLVIPVFQRMVKIDMRIKAVDVPDQDAITRDNISVRVNAVIYYKVSDAARAIIAVENFYFAVIQLAQTTMRNAVGEVDLDTLLKNRDEIAVNIKAIVEKSAFNWGVEIDAVELKDIVLPQDLTRTIAKVAEAEREKKAVIIKAEGELAASENLSKAAKMLAEAPGALHLRTLSTINDLSSDQSNTTIWMVPVEALRAFEGIKNMAETMANKK